MKQLEWPGELVSQWEICTNTIPKMYLSKQCGKNTNPQKANLGMLTVICLQNSKTKENILSFYYAWQQELFGCLFPFL